jgi:short subunit dehydrogenase-like uncharacterized protein
MSKQFDVVIYGATGYTGKLVAEYMAQNYLESDIKWAIAGRSEEKLAAVKAELNIPSVAHIIADASAPDSIASLVANTKCVLSTVGPYTFYGEPLVAACVEAGTDYVDLCGEPLWMAKMIQQYGEKAKQSSARIVHSCGFDSIPFDLGVQYLQEEAIKKNGAPFARVRGRMFEMNGGASGGTLASGAASEAQIAKDPSLFQAMINPFLTCEGYQGPAQPDGSQAVEENGVWAAPFFMAVINTKAVHRSNMLLDFPYGKNFVYDEMIQIGPGDECKAIAEGIAKDPMGAMGPADELPKPGEGPTKEQREAGSFVYQAIGDNLKVEVSADRDPGYGATCKMIAESAICLVKEASDTPGGIHTTASAMGKLLRERLVNTNGIGFKLID